MIGLAYAFEQKTLVRGKIKPYLIPKTEVEIQGQSTSTKNQEGGNNGGLSTGTSFANRGPGASTNPLLFVMGFWITCAFY